MTDPFRSARLIYRAVESPDHDALFQQIQTEPISFQNSNARLIRPQSRPDAAQYQNFVSEKALLGVVICLAPPPDAPPNVTLTAIGVVHLKDPFAPNSPHRQTELGIDIVDGYQGKGYGSEAINWAVQWAFETAGMHRVGIRSFEWNFGARKLYERLGFKYEGTARESLFYKGRFWDDYGYGMLEHEWRDIQAKKEKEQKQ